MSSETEPRLSRPERPIRVEEEDVLERGEFVRRLANSLINPSTKQASGIVVGLTGPWGSGKSSVLNLLERVLREKVRGAVVVRFDPWLVSSRDDVIAAFFSALHANVEKTAGRIASGTLSAIASYGAAVSPALNLLKPGLGYVLSFASRWAEKRISSRGALDIQKANLAKALRALDRPIVVLIDELDRIEEDEIKVMAQVVRSIADFPEISYVLAYDEKRVLQALGNGSDERGRSYLEKIVQLQIPLPVIFDEQLSRLLIAGLKTLGMDTGLPAKFDTTERYEALVKVLIPEIVQTPRDVKRLTETFHAMAGLVRGEVDAIGLLGYCALMTKAPQIVADIAKDPLAFVEDAVSLREAARRLERDKKEPSARHEGLVPSLKAGDAALRKLLNLLFPTLSGAGRGRLDDVIDPICLRRPLLTTLHLGLLEGEYSRADMEKLVHSQESEIVTALREAYNSDKLAALIDRLASTYILFADMNHVLFWKAVAAFLKKPDCNWMAQYVPMNEATRSFAELLERLAWRDEEWRAVVVQVFRNLHNADEENIVPVLVRHHLFIHGLFGNRARGDDPSKAFLNKEQTSALAMELSHTVKQHHMSGKFIPCRWDLQPLYTAIDTGVWDEQCRATLDAALSPDEALDGFTLMLFGNGYATEGATIEKICGYWNYRGRVKARLSRLAIRGAPSVHDSVLIALKKADDDMWALPDKGAQVVTPDGVLPSSL